MSVQVACAQRDPAHALLLGLCPHMGYVSMEEGAALVIGPLGGQGGAFSNFSPGRGVFLYFILKQLSSCHEVSNVPHSESAHGMLVTMMNIVPRRIPGGKQQKSALSLLGDLLMRWRGLATLLGGRKAKLGHVRSQGQGACLQD